jgi:hypothetical protein
LGCSLEIISPLLGHFAFTVTVCLFTLLISLSKKMPLSPLSAGTGCTVPVLSEPGISASLWFKNS